MESIPRCITKLHKGIIPYLGRGSWVYATNGQKYLDFTSGIGALSLGHSHPELIETVSNQMNHIVHVPQQVFGASSPLLDLNKMLLKTMKGNKLNSFFYVNSGSEATDNAIKIARRVTRKPNIISIDNGFHGRTLGALSLNSSSVKTRCGTQPLMSGIFFSEPNEKSLDELFTRYTCPTETAGIIFESVQGEGGIHSLSSSFLKHMETYCKEHNIMMIADEVQCGALRTGEFWNVYTKEVEPDIITFGKGVASGFPLAGLASNKEHMDHLGSNFLGGTYGGNALSSIASCKTVDILTRNDTIKYNVFVQSARLETELQKNENIKEIRVYGLMVGIETISPEYCSYLVDSLRKHNILVLKAGNNSNIVRLMPPLNVTQDEIELFIDVYNKLLLSF